MADYLLQENGDKLLQEDGVSGILLEAGFLSKTGSDSGSGTDVAVVSDFVDIYVKDYGYGDKVLSG